MLEYFLGLLILLLFPWSSSNFLPRKMRGSPCEMEEEDEGITRRTRRSPMGIDEEDKEEITLNIF